MILAAASTIAKLTQNEGRCLGDVNAAVARISGNRVPCYAVRGKRVPAKWVSIGSSCVIPRGEARSFLARVGVDIDVVEAFA